MSLNNNSPITIDPDQLAVYSSGENATWHFHTPHGILCMHKRGQDWEFIVFGDSDDDSDDCIITPDDAKKLLGGKIPALYS